MSAHPDVSESDKVARLGLEASLDPHISAVARRDERGRIIDFAYVAVNDHACTFTGFSRETMLAATVRSLFPEEYANQLVSWLSAVVEKSGPIESFDVAFYNLGRGAIGRFDVRAVSDGDLVSYSFRDLSEVRELVDRYRLLLENSSDVVVRTDMDGRIEWVSDAVSTVLGYSPKELTGELLVTVMHPEDASSREAIRKRLEKELTVRFAVRLRDLEGTFHHFSALVHRVLDDREMPTGFIAGLHLNDAEMAAREAAHKSDELYRLMAQYGTDVIALERRGTIEWVSPYVAQLLNLSSADVVGHSLEDLVHPDDRTSLQSFYRGAHTSDALTLTLRMRMADSAYRWVSLRSREAVDEDTAEKVRVSSWRDAQGDVDGQRALIASENRFRILADNATDVVIECDELGRIRWVSPSSQATLGWRCEKVVATRIDDYVFPGDLTRVAEQRYEIAANHSSTGIEVRYLTPTGNVKWMNQHMRQIRGFSGEADTVVISLRDIDDTVRLRAAMGQTEENFNLLADNVTDVIYTVNLDGELQWVSPSSVGQLGWQSGDVVGHSILDMVFPEDHARVLAWRQLLHFGEVLDQLTIRVRNAAGDFVWMKLRAKPRRDDAGRVIGVVASLHNCEVEVATARALRTISAVSRMLISATDGADLLHQMCQIAVEEGGYLLSWYGRKVHDEKRSIVVVAASTSHESYVEGLEVHWRDDDLGQGPSGKAARSGETCTSSDIDTDSSMSPWRERARQHGFRSTAAIPVVIDGELDGIWQVYAMEPRAFTPEVLTVLEDIAAEIAYGLSRMSSTSK